MQRTISTKLTTYCQSERLGIYGQRVVFAKNAEAATQKVQKTFDDRDDEPITYAGQATKWIHGEVSDCEIYPYWE